MQLRIDGYTIEAVPGLSILDMVQNLGLDDNVFSQRPLAAKIAGEVFNLNYVPVREIDASDRASIRRAMAASNGQVRLLRYSDPVGRDVYERSMQYLVFLALHRIWPDARAKMNCTVGRALYIEVFDKSFSVARLKDELLELIKTDAPLLRRRMTLADAVAYYRECGLHDKAQLLKWREQDYFDVYDYEGYRDYHYGELVPSMGYLQIWDVVPAEGGFMLLFPDDNTPDTVAHYEEMPHFLQVSTEGERWCELMGCECVADLNALVQSGKIRELIRVNEALHEKRYSQIADLVSERGAKAVMLAGPSSSGKTTSANRLATQLRVHGKKPILMSLDDYYVDREKIAPGPDGKLDLEHINTIDTELFRSHFSDLLCGNKVELPTFNFKTGKREWNGKCLGLEESSVIIIEGLHALNPVLLPSHFDSNLVFKLYVSPLLPLNLDDHNRIPTSLLRLLRRIVRDYETRGASVEKTMSMWDSVRRGEKRWIFPYQEKADVIFNSSTLYELAVLKKHIYPLLMQVAPEETCYDEVRAIVKILNYVCEADVDDEIPPTSLVREFIGGNSFYR